MKRFLFTLLLLAQTITAQAAAFAHANWDALLKKHVVSIQNGQATQVDYDGMMKDRAQLKRYLSATSNVIRTTFDDWSKEEQLAFLINAYNAWTVELILSGYPNIESIKDLGSFFQSPWKKAFIPLLGETRSLDDIEHGLIRGSGRYNDPRIHFAVNCASIGCPALRPDAYLAEKLDQQLDEATRLFLSDRTRNRRENDTLYVSSIFKWYRADFEHGWRGAESLEQFLSLYSNPLSLDGTAQRLLLSGSMDVEFLAYNWRLNRTD
ncbi:MAG: DUF547 domain-containing protein [Gammaproteobacteria bacterium]|nr:DUF547 domain-containing protein [Gammaproteobacteria bacterium]